MGSHLRFLGTTKILGPGGRTNGRWPPPGRRFAPENCRVKAVPSSPPVAEAPELSRRGSLSGSLQAGPSASARPGMQAHPGTGDRRPGRPRSDPDKTGKCGDKGRSSSSPSGGCVCSRPCRAACALRSPEDPGS